METPARLVYVCNLIVRGAPNWRFIIDTVEGGTRCSSTSTYRRKIFARSRRPFPSGYTIEFPLEPSFALSRVLREGEPLKYSGNKEEAPCNLAAENRENRKVKMKLQVVKESEVATFSTIYMCIYIYMRCYALSWRKKMKEKRWESFCRENNAGDSSFMRIWQAGDKHVVCRWLDYSCNLSSWWLFQGFKITIFCNIIIFLIY